MSHAQRPHLLVLSAEDEVALTPLANNLADRLEADADLEIGEIAANLQDQAGTGIHRRSFVAATREIAISALRGFEPRRTFSGLAVSKHRVVFLFPGQGSQYIGMGAALYSQEPVFRDAFDECSEILRGEIELRDTLHEELANGPSLRSPLREARLAQPAIFATSYALARLWMASGVQPSACMGHSVGEYVAATIAGIFSLPDALRIVTMRAKLVQSQPTGAMLAVRLSESDIARYLNRHISLAAINAPDVTLLSGSDKAISLLELEFAADGVGAVRVETSHAFHSAMMDAVVEPLRRAIAQVPRQPPKIPILSTITADWMTDRQAVDPMYWAQHVRRTVRFAPAIQRLQAGGPILFLECGPGQNLGQLVRHHHAPNCTVLNSIRENVDETHSMASAIAQLWTRGAEIDWAVVRPAEAETIRSIESSTASFPRPVEKKIAQLPAPPRSHATLRSLAPVESFSLVPPPPPRPKAILVEEDISGQPADVKSKSGLCKGAIHENVEVPKIIPQTEGSLTAEENLQQADWLGDVTRCIDASNNVADVVGDAHFSKHSQDKPLDFTLEIPSTAQCVQRTEALVSAMNAHLDRRNIPIRWESFGNLYFLPIPRELPNIRFLFSHMHLQGFRIRPDRLCVVKREHSDEDIARVISAFKNATDTLVTAKLLPGAMPAALPQEPSDRETEVPPVVDKADPAEGVPEVFEIETSKAIVEKGPQEVTAAFAEVKAWENHTDVPKVTTSESIGEIISFDEFLATEPIIEEPTSEASPGNGRIDIFSETGATSVDSTSQIVPALEAEIAIEEAPLATAVVPPEWNRIIRDYPAGDGLDSLFEAMVAKRGEAIAITDGRRSISYDSLNVQANMLANRLAVAGIQPGSTVGICLERSVELVAATLAIVKIGCAYVPLDPSWPAARLQIIARDSQCATVITKLDLARHFGGLATLLDGPRPHLPPSADDPKIPTRGSDAAYVMYTSGSTGVPKGVVVPHRAVSRLVLHTNYVTLTENDVVAHASNPAFDAATFEIWGPLLNGGRLVVLSRTTMRDATDLGAAIRDEAITTMFVTTELLNKIAAFATGVFKPLQTLLVGGDVLNPRMIARILRHGAPKRLLNVYGPTESTTFACAHLITEVAPNAATIPIGRPITNTEVYILDGTMQPVPIGVEGEIYLGGEGLAIGYFRDSKLTTECFVADPRAAGRRLYRTGDRACWLADGRIEFLGRRDGQIKIRGIRVEPAEIEAELASHPRVSEAAVKVLPDASGEKVLAGYFVARKGEPPSTDEVRAYLRRRLPEPMVPATVTMLDQLPVTENGKVDRAALPTPERSRAIQFPLVLNSTEVRVAELMAATLGLPGVEAGEDFFHLGGQSLLAMDLLARVRKTFGVDVPSNVLLESPTVSGLAKFISEHLPRASAEADFRFLVPIQRGSPGKTPIFLVAGGYGGEIEFLNYAQLARQIDPTQPVYGLKARGVGTAKAPHGNTSEMAADYLEEIRTLQPCGPYFLGGEWVGGICAHEMACQLRDAGEQVDHLILLNTSVPGPDELANYLAEEDQAKDDTTIPGGRMRRYLDKVSSLAVPSKVRELFGRATRRTHSPALPMPATQHPRGIVEYPPTLLRHHLRKYAGRVTLLVDEETAILHGQLGWENAAVGDLDVHIVPGNRVTYTRENSAHTAAVLREVLAGGETQH